MPTKPITIEQRKLLLVEGKDDQNFLRAVLSLKGKVDVQVLEFGGKTRLVQTFGAIKNAPGFDQLDWLGIMRDADSDAADAFLSVQNVLTSNRMAAPAQAWQVQNGQPITVVFILPDGTRQGDLEELVWDVVTNEAPNVANCIAAYFQCLGNLAPLSKARIHAYLATLTPPDHRLGLAAQAGILPLSSTVFDRFISLVP